MNRKVLVTGAGGFIGTNLVRSLLLRGDEVHVLRRPKNAPWRLADIKNKLRFHTVAIDDGVAVLKMMKRIKPDQVFHLAHYGGNPNEIDATEIRKVIIGGTGALFDACANVDSITSIVHAGSSSEYGAKSSRMKENNILEPNSPYGCAKAWATLYGQHLAREKGLPITTLRFFSVFGPWEAKTRFIPTTILACLHGKPIKVFDPKIVRDFIFVGDTVKALLRAGDHPHPGEIINIGFGTQMTLLEAAKLILKSTGTSVAIEIGGNGRTFDKTNKVWQADISKAKRLLDWQPAFSRTEAFAKTVAWYRNHLNFYQ